MHLEKSYSGGGPQMALVDDAGVKHDVCQLLCRLIDGFEPEAMENAVDFDAIVAAEVEKRVTTEVKKQLEKLNADSDTGSARSETDQSSVQEVGAENSQEADSQGSQSGSEGDGGGAEEAGASGTDKKPAKASKGTRRKKKT